MIKKIALCLMVLTGCLLTGTAHAQVKLGGSAPVNNVGGCTDSAAESPICKDITRTDNPLFGKTGIITKASNIFAFGTGIISVFMIILGGLRYVTSSGDGSKTASAKNTIMYAVIGLAVAVSAEAIVKFVLSNL